MGMHVFKFSIRNHFGMISNFIREIFPNYILKQTFPRLFEVYSFQFLPDFILLSRQFYWINYFHLYVFISNFLCFISLQESRGKRPLKIWDSWRNIRKGLVVGSFEELIVRGNLYIKYFYSFRDVLLLLYYHTFW